MAHSHKFTSPRPPPPLKNCFTIRQQLSHRIRWISGFYESLFSKQQDPLSASYRPHMGCFSQFDTICTILKKHEKQPWRRVFRSFKYGCYWFQERLIWSESSDQLNYLLNGSLNKWLENKCFDTILKVGF